MKFIFSGFSARYHNYSDWGNIDGTLGHSVNWVGNAFVNAPNPCSYSGVGSYTSTTFLFMWKWPNSDAACYKIANVDMVGEPYSFDTMSVTYELLTPDPLVMPLGIYTGTIAFTVGAGGDVYQASDTNLTINFTLLVNHELKLTTIPDDLKVSLQPCAPGGVCSEDEGKANWERWMITRITPQLTGRSNFSLSSSGSFAVYLQCEHQSGSDCTLQSDNSPSQTVPVQTMLTLSDNVVDGSTGGTVSKKRLFAGKDSSKNIFVTKNYGENKKGSIDFLVGQRDVDTMLESRPDTYRGAVTVMFDPNIY